MNMDELNEIKNLMRDAIYEALKNIIKKLGHYFLIGLFISTVFCWYMGKFDRDSTDGIDRSNMSLHVDALTGCNYLSGANGGLTPRISSNGQHYGCKGL